ncbi:MAG: DUF1329 domain-containing protein [Pseudomonadota bacterium]
MSLLLLLPIAEAKSAREQIDQLDGDKLTCIGAERAGSKAGVAAYTGKWLDSWPGLKDPKGYDPGPYKDEKPLFTITAENSAQYADRLGEGQKALLKEYPKTFRMPVYASHRDFRFPDAGCAATKHNAAQAKLVNKGLGLVNGIGGGVPFPFAKEGLEAIWNVLATRHVWNETAVIDIANVFANGKIAWGKQKYLTLAPSADPHGDGKVKDNVGAYFYNVTLLPLRDKGTIGVGFQPVDFSEGSTRVWAYNPGTRRLRQAPDIAFDYAVPPSGLRTVDDDHLFNGSPERYHWKLIGKRELYIPYNNFRINDPALKYSTLLTPDTLNPDYMRYELHRVWVIEATLKPGVRHIYGRRVLYADEDTWLAHWADNYDSRGQLWRTAFVNYRYAPDAQAFHRGVSVYQDLNADAYEAGYLVNEAGKDWWRLNRSDMNVKMFSPEAATRGGH